MTTSEHEFAEAMGPHFLHEALTMGLYLSIVLAAVLAGGGETHGSEIRLLWGTGVGLGVAHIFAFRLAATMVRPSGKPSRDDGLASAAIASTVVVVCGIASIPFVFWTSTNTGVTASSYVLIGLVGLTAAVSGLRAGAALNRALIFAAIAMAAASVIVVLKNALGH